MSTGQATHLQEERAREGRRASFVGLIVNALLAVSKIIMGGLSGSVSILADGINNLSDTGSVLISAFSLHLARKPGDQEHPFGHGRMEYIGSLAIAVVILFVGIDLLRSSIEAIIKPEAPLFTWLLVLVTALSIPAKIFLWFFYKKRGKAYNMGTLIAAAQDSINDVFITSAVLLGLFASHFLNIQVDGWLGALVSLLILWTGIKLIRDTVTDLLGGKPDMALGQKVLDILKNYPEISGVHDFVLHDYGPGRSMASIHAEVDARSSLLDVHEFIDQAEQEVMEKLGLVITIHMDPVMPLDAPGQELKAAITAFLSEQTPPLSMHDFRVVPGKRMIKLVFDVVVPADFHDEGLKERIEGFAQSLDARHHCVIQLDRDYFSNPEVEAP